ncbi:MAG: alpha/beta fold hydrolase [Desulfatitalea sp.]|nr:alpha/beta fold hydrolase [Desulfatitalea sp.]
MLLDVVLPCPDAHTQASADPAPANADPEWVILLHGLGRTRRSMNAMAKALEAAGYRTVNLGYPSREATVEALAMQAIPAALDQCTEAGAKRIHFVTHSMGGLLVRSYLTRQPLDKLGRVVMLCPPNQGSEVCNTLRDNFFYRWYNGPAGQQLGTGPEDLPARLGPVDFALGVITGNVHSFFDGWLAEMIPGEDDGKVAVERTKVAGMTDFLVLPYSHSFIMAKEETIAQTLHFLRAGVFQPRP